MGNRAEMAAILSVINAFKTAHRLAEGPSSPMLAVITSCRSTSIRCRSCDPG